MKHVLLAGTIMLGASAIAAADGITPTQIVAGVVKYPYVDGVAVPVYCEVGRTCDIAFKLGEKLQDVVSPGSTKRLGPTGWTIDLGAGDPPRIYVTPADGSPTTNLIVTTTDHRRYSAILIPKYTSHISYAIGQDEPTPGPSLAPTVTPTPITSDRDFTVDNSMHAPFAPIVTPERVGDLTRVQLPPGYYAKPDIAQYFESGKSWKLIPVGWSYEIDTREYVVQGIFPVLALYVGDGKDQIRVLIRRDS